MSTPGVPAPGFVRRIGEIVDRRRGVEFQELKSRSLVNRLTGSAMPFGWTVNPFRGCEFGCRYCYARPTHEYLGHRDPEECESDLHVNFSLISLDADLLRLIEPRAPRPDLRLRAMRLLSEAGVPTRLFIMPVLPLITDGEGGLRPLLVAGRTAGAREAICQPLFLRTPMTWSFFLRFIETEFPWAMARYRTLYPRPGSAPREYRDAVERRVEGLARAAGFQARSRDERIRDEAPPRSRQLSLVW